MKEPAPPMRPRISDSSCSATPMKYQTPPAGVTPGANDQLVVLLKPIQPSGSLGLPLHTPIAFASAVLRAIWVGQAVGRFE